MTKAIQIRVDQKLKKDAEKVFAEIGIDTPTAIRMFLMKVTKTGSIPFSLTTKKSRLTENGFTPEQEDEILRAEKEDDYVGPFNTAEEMIAALHKHAKQEDAA